MKFSILIVTYNSEAYLRDTLNSIISQSFKDYEVVLKDAGSSDETVDIFNEYMSQSSKFRIVQKKDTGLADAMNQAASEAKGDYIIYLHSDDIFNSSDCLSSLSSVIENNSDVKWGFGFYKYIDASGNVFKEDNLSTFISFKSHLLRNIVRHQSAFVSRSVFNELQFSEKYRFAMDYDFFLRLWEAHEPVVVREHISRFRVSGTNLSSDYYASISDEYDVRKAWRKERGGSKLLHVFDFFVYYARIFKLRFIHGKKRRK